MQITRDKAIELFTALGVTTASKWNAKRMAAKLTKISEMVDEDTTIEGEADETLTAVLTAIEAGEDIEIADGGAKEEEKKEEGKTAAKKKEAPAPATDEERGTRTMEELPKVRKSNTRMYYAGIVLKEHGYTDEGITQKMVDDLNVMYGKANQAESFYALRDAWHVIRGYINTK